MFAEIGKSNLTAHIDANYSIPTFLTKSVNDEVAKIANLANNRLAFIHPTQANQPLHGIDNKGRRYLNFPNNPPVVKFLRFAESSSAVKLSTSENSQVFKPPFDLYLVAFIPKRSLSSVFTATTRTALLSSRCAANGINYGMVIYLLQGGSNLRIQCGFWNDQNYCATYMTPDSPITSINYNELFLLRFTATESLFRMNLATKRNPNLLNYSAKMPAGSTTNNFFQVSPILGNGTVPGLAENFVGGIYEMAVFNRELTPNEDYTITNFLRRKYDI